MRTTDEIKSKGFLRCTATWPQYFQYGIFKTRWERMSRGIVIYIDGEIDYFLSKEEM